MDRFTITSTVFDAPQNGHKIAAKIYTPRREASDPGRGHVLTLLLVHAAGFHKEIWEPTLETLPLDSTQIYDIKAESRNEQTPRLHECEAYNNTNGYVSAVLRSAPTSNHYLGRWYINRIVAIDIFNHGDSFALNQSKLDRKPTWSVIARDLADVSRRVRSDSMLVGVGHSLGASIILTAQIVNPGLFDAIFAVEPILAPNPNFKQTFDHILKSRTVWKSERYATKHVIDHPFYATWDPRSHKVYLRYGLSPTEGPTAETQDGHTMTPAQALKPNCHSRDEFETYVGGWNECVWAIEHLREIICPTRFLTGQLSSVCPNPLFTKAYASSCFLSDARVAKGLGHLIVMESPETTAHQMGIFLDDILVVTNGLRMRSLI